MTSDNKYVVQQTTKKMTTQRPDNETVVNSGTHEG